MRFGYNPRRDPHISAEAEAAAEQAMADAVQSRILGSDTWRLSQRHAQEQAMAEDQQRQESDSVRACLALWKRGDWA